MGATLDGSQPAATFDFVVSGFMWDEYTRTESSNDTYEQYWTSVYEAISAANHALAAIETLPTSEQANAGKQRAEALMTRAYNHFTLLTMYANMFDSKFADVNTNMNPGVPYVTEPEDVVIKYYDRGTVAGTLEKIKNDFNQAIRDIGGSADYALYPGCGQRVRGPYGALYGRLRGGDRLCQCARTAYGLEAERNDRGRRAGQE